MFEFDFDDMPEPSALEDAPQGSAGAGRAPHLAYAAGSRLILGDVDVEVLTLGGGIVSTLRLPPSTTAEQLKERLQKIVNMPAPEQRLVIGTSVFDGAERLNGFVTSASGTVQVSVIHVPSARSVAISGSRDGSLRLWDLDRGGSFRELRGEGATVTCMSAVWPSRRALCGSSDGLLRLWDLGSGKKLRDLRGHRAGVTCLAAEWGWQRALSGDEEGSLVLWDLERCTPEGRLPGHAASVLCVALCMEANSALTGGADNTLRLWAVQSGELFLEFPSHTPVNCLAARLTKEPPVGVAGSFTILRFRSLHQWPVHWDLPVHTAAVTCVAVHWESLYMVSGSSDTTVICGRMNLNTNKVEDQKVMRGHSMAVTSLSTDWERRRAISGSEDGTLRFWDLDRGICLQELTGHGRGVLCVQLSLEGGSPPTDADTGGKPRPPMGEDLSRARREAGVVEQSEALDDLALGRPAQASSVKRIGGMPNNAVDGDPNTRWTSEYADSQWLTVDLGDAYVLSHVEIRWESAFAETYTLHNCVDGSSWKTMAAERGRDGWVVTRLPPKTVARWVRVFGQKRATQFGFSIYEFRVYGAARPSPS